MIDDTAIFPLPSEISTLLAVRSEDTTEEAPPVMVACFPLICVWIADVTPDKYQSSVAVTLDAATFPPALDTRALEAVRSDETIDDAPQVIASCFASRAFWRSV